MVQVLDRAILVWGCPHRVAVDNGPESISKALGAWAAEGLVNIVGGCCGTTPEHIAAIGAAVAGRPPRRVPERPKALRLSGLEAFELAS